MKKRTGAIVLFSIGVLFGVYCLFDGICHHARPVSIVLDAILLVLFASQLFLTWKGIRKQDNHNTDK